MSYSKQAGNSLSNIHQLSNYHIKFYNKLRSPKTKIIDICQQTTHKYCTCTPTFSRIFQYSTVEDYEIYLLHHFEQEDINRFNDYIDYMSMGYKMTSYNFYDYIIHKAYNYLQYPRKDVINENSNRQREYSFNLKCKCSRSEIKAHNLEPTAGFDSLTKGASYSFKALNQFSKVFSKPVPESSSNDIVELIDPYKQNIEEWSLDVLNLAMNFNIPTLMITLLKLVSKVTSLFDIMKVVVNKFLEIIKQVSEYLGKTLDYFINPSTPTQPPTGVEASSGYLEHLSSLDNFGIETPVIASVMSAVVITIGGVLIGKNACKNTGGLDLAKSMMAVAKTKSGIYAVLEMFSDFKNYLQLSLQSMFSGDSDDVLVRLIQSSNIQDTEECKKKEVFEYIELCLHPDNSNLILSSSLHQKHLDFAIVILDDIRARSASLEFKIPKITHDYLYQNLIELKKIRLSLYKNRTFDPTRFTPFWINMAGASGTRKSTFASLLSNSILEILQMNGGYGVPDKENWVYPVNFSDKYLSAYRQHYMVMIDDFLQDAAPLGDRSSALDIISWVSCIPHFTNQAGVFEKGIPFTSKMIITTTNDLSFANRKEIISVQALQRRIRVNCEFKKDKSFPIDPLLGDTIKIQVSEYTEDAQFRYVLKPVGEMNSTDFIKYCVKQYISWYALQQKILSSRNLEKKTIKSLYQDLFPIAAHLVTESEDQLDSVESKSSTLEEDIKQLEQEEEKLETPMELEATAGRSIRCRFGYNPPLIIDFVDNDYIDVFDCDCTFHQKLNEEYKEYYRARSLSCDKTVFNFKEYVPPSSIPSVIQFKNACIKIKDNILEVLKSRKAKFFIGAFSGAIAAYGAYKIYEIIGTKKVAPTAAQYQIGTKRPKVLKSTLVASSGFTEQQFSQPGIDNQSIDIIRSVVTNGNVARLIRTQDGLVGTCIRLKDDYILTNHHYFSMFEENEEFNIYIHVFNKGCSTYRFYYNSENMKQVGKTDLCIYRLGASVPSARNIINNFPDDDVTPRVSKSVILTAYPDFETIVNVTAKPVTSKIEYESQNGKSVYNILNSYVTDYPVIQGSSGSLLISTDTNAKFKFLGIQTCRNTAEPHNGYYKPLSKKMILDTLNQFDREINYSIEADGLIPIVQTTSGNCPPNLMSQGLEYLGEVPKSKIIKQKLKTKLQPSLIQDPSTLTQLPSVLSDNDDRMLSMYKNQSVLFRAIEGFGHQVGAVRTDILKNVSLQLSIDYDVTMNILSIPRRLLNDYEMVNGIPGVITKLEMKSSPGYPYIQQRKITTLGGKKEWFKEIEPLENYTIAHEMLPILKSGVEQREARAKQGLNVQTVAYVCLKDETRPIQKIQHGKTRAFICLPMDFNLLVRKYFGAFVATQHSLAGTISSCVGIDPATQWKSLYERLNEKNALWEDFDYTNWDQHLHPDLIYKVASIINYWYGDADDSENGNVRRVLIKNLINTLFIAKDRVFVKNSGQCSGCAITAELNCIVHELLMIYVWFLLCESKGLFTSVSEFRKYVAMGLYGDDIVFSVDPESPIVFNGNTIKPIVETLGMTITPGDKNSTEFVVKTPNNLEFLKRSFRAEGNYVKAPLRKEVIENIPQWIHKSDDKINATVVNCEAAIQESYMHGEIYFNKLVKDINNKIKLYNQNIGYLAISPVVAGYRDYEAKYTDDKFVCIGVPKFEQSSDTDSE